MAHVTIPDTSPRVQYSVGATSTTDFSIPYAYFEDADIVVYVGSTLKTLTTDYTITGTAVDEGYSGGTVVLNTGVINTTVTVLRDVPVERVTDFPTNGPFNITQLNSELDKMTAQLQQEESGHDLFLKVADYDTYTDLTLPDLNTRKGKFLYFDSTTGDPEAYQVVGVWQGSDATTTTADYVKFDIVKDSSNNNVYICTADSTTGTALTNTSYWALLVDAASAASSSSSASGFADEAEEWATKTDGIVESTDYSSKAWSIGGTGVTTTSGKGAAKEWATSTGAAVDTSEYSAKEYAVGDLTATGGSAKAWAIDSSSPDGSSEKSAKTLAGEAATSASNASTSETNASNAQTYAEEWANKAEDSLISTAAGGDGSTEYSARHWAAKAADDAAGVAALYDAFDDRYLGSKASDPTLDNDGAALTDGALYFNTTSNVLKVYDLGSTTWLTIPQQTLASMTDVTLTSIASGEILKWNGSEWINNTLAEAGIVGTSDIANMLETTDIGVTVQAYDADTAKLDTAQTWSADQTFGDNVKAQFGAGSDLKIYHNGTDSFIDDAGTGDLFIRSNRLYIGKYTGEQIIAATADAGADLYYDNAVKFATTSTGVSVTGKAVGTLTTDNDLSFDMNASNQFKCTPTANGTLTFTNITAGQSGNIFLVNSGGYAISAAATTYISAADLSAISTAGSYFLSYFSDGTNVMVSASAAVTSAGA